MDEPGGNAAQIDYWNEQAGPRWVAQQARIDAQFAELTAAAIAHAGPRPGERVLDLGCGCGASVLALARAVGPGGAVLGVDVSGPMLALARERVTAEKLAGVRLLRADAARLDLGAEPEAPFDGAFSRFGVMFFADPAAAFANIRRGLRPGARLSFVTWRPIEENAWFLVPLQAAAPHLPPAAPTDPEAPGPFAFAAPDRVRRLLQAAGFADIAIAPHDPVFRFGPAAEAAAFTTQIGGVARALAEAAPETRARAVAAIRAEMERRDGPDGVRLDGAVWLVSATA